MTRDYTVFRAGPHHNGGATINGPRFYIATGAMVVTMQSGRVPVYGVAGRLRGAVIDGLWLGSPCDNRPDPRTALTDGMMARARAH